MIFHVYSSNFYSLEKYVSQIRQHLSNLLIKSTQKRPMKLKSLPVPVFIDYSFQENPSTRTGQTNIREGVPHYHYKYPKPTHNKCHSAMDSREKNVMPCAACKLLRRRCTTTCIFLPHFPPSEPHKFAAIHKIFGASNVTKMLKEIPDNDRGDAVTSLVYEATARLQDPVYGCVSLISSLRKQLLHLQSEIQEVTAEKVALEAQLSSALSVIDSSNVPQQLSPFGSGYYASDIMPLRLQAADSSYEELESMTQSFNVDFSPF